MVIHVTVGQHLVTRLRAPRSISDARAREELAGQLRRIVAEAREARMPGARIAPHRPAVNETADELRLLASRLQAPRPVAARGVAQARELLTDGRGPLYDPRRAEELRGAVRDAVAALDRVA